MNAATNGKVNVDQKLAVRINTDALPDPALQKPATTRYIMYRCHHRVKELGNAYITSYIMSGYVMYVTCLYRSNGDDTALNMARKILESLPLVSFSIVNCSMCATNAIPTSIKQIKQDSTKLIVIIK